MAGKVVGVIKSLEEKAAFVQELLEKGVSEENITIITKCDEDGKKYKKYFKQGDYVVIIDERRAKSQQSGYGQTKIQEKRTPDNHHHFPHHQMKQGM